MTQETKSKRLTTQSGPEAEPRLDTRGRLLTESGTVPVFEGQSSLEPEKKDADG